jgi:hypothetical protein
MRVRSVPPGFVIKLYEVTSGLASSQEPQFRRSKLYQPLLQAALVDCGLLDKRRRAKVRFAPLPSGRILAKGF